MAQILVFVVLGLGSGALISGIATGLVVMYRGSGIINLATGAQAMVAGYAFWGFRTGEFGFTMSTWPSAILAVLVVVLVGALMELLAFRWLRNAAPLAKIVASLGILLFLTSAFILLFGPEPVNEPSVLPSGAVSVMGTNVPEAGVIVAGAVLIVAIGLTCLYRYTRFGLATRAAAENEMSATLVGLSPNSLAMANTLLACFVVGILGVLAGSLTSLDPSTVPLLVIPALAAALFARFTSALIASVVGLLIGAGENLMYYASVQSWFPKDQGAPLPGLNQLIEFLLIVLALFLMGSKLPGRSAVVERRLPVVPMPQRLARPAVRMSLVTVAVLIFLPYGWREATLTTEVAIVLMLSIVVISGYVGQISVAELPLAGVAGFTMAHVASAANIGFPLAPLLGALAATAVGILIGASALRVRGVQLAVVGLAAAVALEQFWFTNTVWGTSVSGNPVQEPSLFGLNLGNQAPFRGIDNQTPSPVLGFLFLAVTVAAALFVANLRRTGLGQRMLAVRANERAAAGVGISVRNIKLTAFAISSFLAGLSGAMAAYNYGSVSAYNYDPISSLSIVAFAYIGGITTVTGAIAAGIISTQALMAYFFETYLHIAGSWALLVGGFFLVFNMIFAPNGVGLATRRDVGRLGRRLRRLVLSGAPVASSAIVPPDDAELEARVATGPVRSPEVDI